MHIIVVDHNPEWAEAFKDEAAQIKRILGNNLLQIFHIGSTSVPGLQAKPIIDIMPVVRSLARVDACAAAFEGIGYEVMASLACRAEDICVKAVTTAPTRFIRFNMTIPLERVIFGNSPGPD